MSTPPLTLRVLGIGLWGEGMPGWVAARAVLRGESPGPVPMPGPPPISLLAPAERRRASASVRVAIAVAEEACAQAGVVPSTLLSVFASTHGEIGLTDEICRTLAERPTEMSPTRFHNSVHNAASGYWTIGAGCAEASTAVSAWHASFAAGLLEAAVQAACEDRPVLFVAYDAAATGPLARVADSGSTFGAALLLAPASAGSTGPSLRLQIADGPSPTTPNGTPPTTPDPTLPTTPDPTLPPLDTPLSACLPLFAALAREQPAALRLALGAGAALALKLALEPGAR